LSFQVVNYEFIIYTTGIHFTGMASSSTVTEDTTN